MSQATAKALPTGVEPGGIRHDSADGITPAAWRRLLSWKTLVFTVCVLFTVYIAVVPLGFLLWQSFFTPQTASKAAEFTWGNYLTAYTSSDTARLFFT